MIMVMKDFHEKAKGKVPTVRKKIKHIAFWPRVNATMDDTKAILHRRCRRNRILLGFKNTGNAYSIIERMSALETRTTWS